MTWQTYAVLGLPMITFKVLTIRSLARIKRAGMAPFVLNAAISTLQFIVGISYVLLRHTDIDLSTFSRHWLYIISGGLLFAIANGIGLKIFSYFDSAVGTVISTGGVFWTIIFASLWLNEQLTAVQFIGGALLFPVIWYVLLLDRSKAKLNFHIRTISISFVYMLVIGLAVTNEKYLLDNMSITTYLLIGWGWQMIMSWLLTFFQRRTFKVLSQQALWWRIGLIGFLSGIAGFCFIEAQVKSDNVALISIISSFRLILVALLAGWFLHEWRYYFKKIAASAVAAVGVILTMWK